MKNAAAEFPLYLIKQTVAGFIFFLWISPQASPAFQQLSRADITAALKFASTLLTVFLQVQLKSQTPEIYHFIRSLKQATEGFLHGGTLNVKWKKYAVCMTFIWCFTVRSAYGALS